MKNDSPSSISDFRQHLDKLLQETKNEALTPKARKILEEQIRGMIQGLGKFLNDLDPIRQPSAVFDPSNPKIVGRFVSLALVAQSRHSLSEIGRFYGSGVYAIYYNGNF